MIEAPVHHVIFYDLARGLHVISVIGWIAGMLMLPRFYASITASPSGEALEQDLLRTARTIRAILLTPFMVLSWSFGLFLFFTYFAPDWDAPLERLALVPAWFWVKLALVLLLTAYHGVLVAEGKRLARGERKVEARVWRILSVVPFLISAVIVVLATIEP